MIEITIEIATTVVLYSFDGTCAHYCICLVLVFYYYYYLCSSINSCSLAGLAPIKRSTTSPPLIKTKVGMAETLYFAAAILVLSLFVCWWLVVLCSNEARVGVRYDDGSVQYQEGSRVPRLYRYDKRYLLPAHNAHIPPLFSTKNINPTHSARTVLTVWVLIDIDLDKDNVFHGFREFVELKAREEKGVESGSYCVSSDMQKTTKHNRIAVASNDTCPWKKVLARSQASFPILKNHTRCTTATATHNPYGSIRFDLYVYIYTVQCIG
jgi:hypothetical protein